MNTLAIIVSIVGGLLVIAAAVVGLWVIPLYNDLKASHASIRAKNDEIDAVEPGVNGSTAGFVNESQRLAQVARVKEPLLRQLARLEQERQFIVDRLPFFK